MDKSDKLFAINQSLPGLECFLREVLGNEELSSEAETKRQEFLKRLELISTPPSLPPRPPQLPPRLYLRNDSGNRVNDETPNLLYNNDDPVAFASRQRELSRNITYSRNYGYVGRRDLFGEDSPIYAPQIPPNNYSRDSIKSSSSDELYERLSFSGDVPLNPPGTPITVVPEEPIPPQDSSATSNLGARGGVGRGSGGKGKLTSGWFKKEVKLYDTIHLSDITDPIIQGYLRDVKSKQRRWCVLKDEKLYIFKTRDDPCSQIIDLPNCDIGVDDKKKISYSFSLRQSGAPTVQLAIEAGHDLSPWMSAIMAAAVRRSHRPTSPQERTTPPDKPPRSPFGYMRINIPSNDNEDASTYEVPVECFSEIFNKSGYHSTPVHQSTPTNNDEHYNPPLPPLPMDSDSSSESSSDDEDTESPITPRKSPNIVSNKVNRRSLIDEGSSPSDHSSHGLGDTVADSDVKEEKGPRKRSSTALSNASIDSTGSGSEMSAKPHYQSRKSSITYGPRTKRRRKQTSAESEAKFLQDPNATHSGILFQKRPLGVWSKRYCKLTGDQLNCYRHAEDIKPSLTIPLHDYDITLIDSKESKKAYGFKVSHPTQESYWFATDSRVSVERWIELLSLAVTGRQDIVAPYPPYFKSDSAESQDSLIFSEDALESGDATDFASDRSVRLDDDTSSFAADELDGDLSSDTRDDNYRPRLNQRRVKSPQRRSPRYSKGDARERVTKRKNEKKRAETSPDESPYAVGSSSHGQFIGDSSGEGKPDSSDLSTKALSTDTKKEKPKGWAESLKQKQQRFARGHSFSAIIAGNTPEASKNRLNNMKKTSMQSYSRLLSLLDREGRFSGFLTEVKVSKYSRTQLRRWCIVKNGVLNLYNKQDTEEEPAFKLNLAEMWLVDNTEELKSKYAFELHDKEGRTFVFQVTQKEGYDKWLEVLRAFTELTVGRPSSASTVEQHDKSKSKEDSSVNTFSKRSSIRLKLSQKVNVIDIFKRSQTYDFENPTSGEVALDEVKCINFTGGQLTEVSVTDDHYTWSRVRWCTIKNSELLIYQDNDSDDPIKRIVLYSVRLEEACEPDKDIYKFKIHRMNDTTTLIANNKTDYERWVKQIQDAIVSYGRHDHENSKCRFPSPPRVFGHRRTRSKSLQMSGGTATTSDLSSAASSPEKRLSQLSFGSDLISTGSEGSTDTLMNGHLQESVPGGTEGATKWCAVTSEFFFVYDKDDQLKPSKTMILQDCKVQEEKFDSNLYSFSLQRGDERFVYGHEDKDVVAQWLSVLQRYCHSHEDRLSPLIRCSKPTKSLSDDNLKSHMPSQEKRFLRKTLSEGKASGRRLLRKISEDNLLHRYRRSDLFKAPWKSSLEKDIAKSHDASNCDIERRFSCGSLFDSGGRCSGYLVELVTRPLCRSEVRRWCVLSDDSLYIYDQPKMDTYRSIIPIKNLELLNESNFEENKFVLKLRSEEAGSHVFKMANRNDFEKWIAALTVKINVLKSRRQPKGPVIDEEQTAEQETSTRYTLTPASIMSVSSSVASDISNDDDEGVKRSLSNVSNDSVFAKLRPLSSAQTQSSQSLEETSSCPGQTMVRNFENMHLTDNDANSDDTLKSDSLINLGSFKVPWVAVDTPESTPTLPKDLNPQPIYQNVKDVDPVYENVTLGAPQGLNTLTSMTVEQIDVKSPMTAEQLDLKSQEGKLKYRKFQQRVLSDEEESMFIDMLPKRTSMYELGPLYENLQLFNANGNAQEMPLWSIRSSKDYEDVFVLNSHNSLKSGDDANARCKDRFSIASDYSGIVGEALLEEVGSCSTSRSGTLSSQTSAADQHDAAFDKELLSDILGVPVSDEEACEISEFCAQCDQETDQERSSNDGRRSSTLTNRQSDVFFDAISELNELDSKNVTSQLGRASLGSHGSSCGGHDTYFGPSSSDEESFTDCQGFSTPHSSPHHKLYSTGNVQGSDQSFQENDQPFEQNDESFDHVYKADSGDVESNPELKNNADSNEINSDLLNDQSLHRLHKSEPKESSEFDSNTSSTPNRQLVSGNYASLDFNDIDKHGPQHSTPYGKSSGDSPSQSNKHHNRKENYASLQYPRDETRVESSQEEDLDAASRLNKDSNSVEILKSEDESIVYVGSVIANEEKSFHSAQSSLDELDKSFDSNVVVMREKSSSVPPSVRQELTKSQTEFIKAVTDAFEGIDLSVDEDDSVDTKF